MPQAIGDVSREVKIQLGKCYHGRVLNEHPLMVAFSQSDFDLPSDLSNGLCTPASLMDAPQIVVGKSN